MKLWWMYALFDMVVLLTKKASGIANFTERGVLMTYVMTFK